MDLSVSVVARETSQGLGPVFGLNGLPRPMPPKMIKKPKKAVLFFEVEILDAKTREKLCFLDKVGPWYRLCWPEGAGPATREMGVPLHLGPDTQHLPLRVCRRGTVPGPAPASLLLRVEHPGPWVWPGAGLPV